MDKVINMNELIGAAAGDQQHMLGKFLYFSLANLLVDKDELSHLCESLGIPYSGSNRLSVSDAFRSATGDIRERIPVTENSETKVVLIFVESPRAFNHSCEMRQTCLLFSCFSLQEIVFHLFHRME